MIYPGPCYGESVAYSMNAGHKAGVFLEYNLDGPPLHSRGSYMYTNSHLGMIWSPKLTYIHVFRKKSM